MAERDMHAGIAIPDDDWFDFLAVQPEKAALSDRETAGWLRERVLGIGGEGVLVRIARAKAAQRESVQGRIGP